MSCSTGNVCTELCIKLIQNGSRSNACSSLNYITHLYDLNRNALFQHSSEDLYELISYELSPTAIQHAVQLRDFIDFRDTDMVFYHDLSTSTNYLCEM